MAIAAGPVRQLKILVIDDEAPLRTMVAGILGRAGYQVVIADDGDHGLALFHQERPAMVICDLNMPQRNGVDTIAQMRRESPAMKIIAMTGAGTTLNADGLATALENGASDIILKPFLPEDLLTLVAKVLE